jgi:hypothetical protein
MEMIATCPALADLAQDVRAAAWLLGEDDPLRGYLDLVGTLPPTPDGWLEVISPWTDAARRGEGPRAFRPEQFAALGALGVSALRAARELGDSPALAAALRCVGRSCFFLVRPAAH